MECRGAQHRIGLVDGVLAPLDHDPAEIRGEELLAALTGAPLPCLRAIDEAHRHPDCLTGVRERLDHGDTAGALAVVPGSGSWLPPIRAPRRPRLGAEPADYTYRRPSRRSAGVPGAVLPSLRRRPPRVCVVIDTSGSVSDAELGSALLEVAAISRAVGGRRDLITVLPCDAAARIVHPLCRGEGIPLMGGGGTDLRTGFAKALRARARPDVIVVLTDGQTPWPAAQPPCRTVVGLFPRQHAARSWDEDDPDYVPDSPPAWARVVDIGSSPAAR